MAGVDRVDESYMRMALDCARRGRGLVEPNPMVGAVLVKDGRLLSMGHHGRFGGPHAEVEALRSAAAAGADVRGATMYVTLEPCCHVGKTPPCTDAILQSGVSRVVAALEDADSRVAGKGFAILRDHGVEVVTGVCEAPARSLLAAYVKLKSARRPWVICKWAQTADGFLSPPGGQQWITGQAARTHVHEIRRWCSGVLVGVETLLADDPLLTCRLGAADVAVRQPARLVLDSQLRTPPTCQLVRTANLSPVIVATLSDSAALKAGRAQKLTHAGVEVLELPRGRGGVDLEALLDELGRREWTYLLVEGGAKVLSSFVYGQLADELLVFVNPQMSGGEAGRRSRFDLASVRDRMALGAEYVTEFGPDRLYRLLVPH
ncbi:MAG: bifunctional diaminohydroxyphosphoribosylaminopyrimidine deaminase/5-amino-6-(5-phosphoribosylamino)uracil reductase RibD [Planctomycetota bacterium]|nr:bifunctional diaminohydroxyphosphoribosylaminopyrimidine deaminase/5-amino-6-(5-phosphoribosylamino)uracil reductase RibD [Planctomycetota bacterium]